jgi:hypothetical protein
VILPKSVIAGVLDGSVTTARVPFDAFGVEEWTDQNGRTVTRPKVPAIVQLRAAHERPEDHNPSRPAPAGDPLCKLRITEWQVVGLEDTEDEHAHEEGYGDVDELALSFMDCYGVAWTGSDGIWLRFERDRSDKKLTYHAMPWDPGTEDGRYRRAPEPEGVSHAQASQLSRQVREQRERAERARVAWYRERSLADQLRAIQQDEVLAKRHKNSLKLIGRRLQAIWDDDDGKAA